jgi:oxaloacetate decarboxylase alpha subunit
MRKIKINDLSIRDIFQNIDAKYITEKLLNRIIEQIAKVKFDCLEIFGGSSFEKMLENSFQKTPFEIAYQIKIKIPNTPLQASIGAKNLVGMEVYSNSVVKEFIDQCIKSGITKFRIYDALNDIENFKFIVSTIRQLNCQCQGIIIYDDLKQKDFYINTAQKLSEIGCESICIKDVESTLLPQKAQELFKILTEQIKLQFYLSVYNLRGLQVSNYYNACMAGCSGIDLSFIPSSYNDLSPAIFPFILSFKDTEISVDLDYLKILEAFEWFKQNLYHLIRNDLLHSRFIFSNKNQNLLPKWLLSNINNQLSEIGENNKIDIVLEEVFKIKNEIGNPSLATPIGQIIGSQAILNTIISDHRWEITNDEIKKLIAGYYGKLPREVDKNLLNKISEKYASGSKTEVENSDLDYISEEKTAYEQYSQEIINHSEKKEDILSYIFFPEKTLKLLESKKYPITENQNGKGISALNQELKFPEFFQSKPGVKFENIDLKKIKEITNLVETSNIDEIKLEIDGVKISINKKTGTSVNSSENQNEVIISKEKNELHDEKKSAKKLEEKNLIKVKSPIVGVFYRSPSPGDHPFVNVGDHVKKGDTLCIIEAMKLMNKINSEHDGEITEIPVNNEDAVEYDQTIMTIKPNKL